MNLNRGLSLIVIAIYLVLVILKAPSGQRENPPSSQPTAENHSPVQTHPLPQGPFYKLDSLPLRLVGLGCFVLVPLFCIWFPEVAANIRSGNSGRQNDQFVFDPKDENRTHEGSTLTLFTLIGGWVFLVGVPILYFLLSLNAPIASTAP